MVKNFNFKLAFICCLSVFYCTYNALADTDKVLDFFRIKDTKTKTRIQKLRSALVEKRNNLKKIPRNQPRIVEIDRDLYLIDKGINPFMMLDPEKYEVEKILKNKD